jgi:hypothetical protein
MSPQNNTQGPIFCLAARYENAETFFSAVKSAADAGYSCVETCTPFSVDGISETLKHTDTFLPWFVFFCGLFGGFSGFAMQYIAFVWEYPLNIGGRPFNSWPAFIPITFELTILCSVLSALLGFLIRCSFPQLHHPVFNTPSFERASVDSFFMCIMAEDAKFDIERTREFLAGTGPNEVSAVKNDQ